MMMIRRLTPEERFEGEKIAHIAFHVRRENPEATLSELAEMPDPPVSKSAVNHRMRKLMELSKTL